MHNNKDFYNFHMYFLLSTYFSNLVPDTGLEKPDEN